MKDSQTEEQKILSTAKAIANSQAFPNETTFSKGMNYEQYLIGQAVTGLMPYLGGSIIESKPSELSGKDTDIINCTDEWVSKKAIKIASTTIIELAKQQMVNEDD